MFVEHPQNEPAVEERADHPTDGVHEVDQHVVDRRGIGRRVAARLLEDVTAGREVAPLDVGVVIAHDVLHRVHLRQVEEPSGLDE